MFRPDKIILSIAALAFFLSTSILAWGMPAVYNSPDENANATFAQEFFESSRLAIVEPLNFEVYGALHPRSVKVVSQSLVPGSFLGLPVIYGALSKLFGFGLVRYYTLILAVLGVFAWRSVVEKLFGSRTVALIASLAVLFHPGFWYYAGRSMMHNVPFVSLLMIGAFFAIVQPFSKSGKKKEKKRHPEWLGLDLAVAGVFVGLALFFRTFELVWVAAASVSLLIVFKEKIGGWSGVALFGFGVILALSPMIFLNRDLYGGALATGYTVQENIELVQFTTLETPETLATPATTSASFLLPFGFHPKSILRHAWYYTVQLFPWMSIAAFLGFVAMIGKSMHARKEKTWLEKIKCWWQPEKKEGSNVLLAYSIAAIAITLWLWIVYGSWVFTDNPDPKLVTIGTSYVRYWLPVFVLASPFVGYAIVWFTKLVKPVYMRGAAMLVLVGFMIGLNVFPVFYANDGLAHIKPNLENSFVKQQRVLELTEETAIIIVDRADKFLWPERRVIQPLRSDQTYGIMPTLHSVAPLYYFGITLPEKDLIHLNDVRLEGGLQVEFVETIQDESLYRLTSP